ncbi:hypothetical protein SLEP1_g22638 [Rubroshorea leprosula]|uniref:Uncharacterized protein n=1 Tax=Rubroshorea leprosula TaxID=152421 RepID=A0AAV5J9T2_9ROSI|nr:hypothetical protein SLEP1_g22638 [Rubroshorea leprosula]
MTKKMRNVGFGYQLTNRSEIENKTSVQDCSGSRFGVIELAKNKKNGDKADEAETHDKDNGGRGLQAGGIINIKAQHVTARARVDRARSRRGHAYSELATTHTNHCGCRAAQGP